MALNYQLLNEDSATFLRRQRLLDLETEHYSLILETEEWPPGFEDKATLQKLHDVEMRIGIHRQALGLSPEVRIAEPEQADESTESEREPAGKAG